MAAAVESAQRISSSQRCCHRYWAFGASLAFEGHGWPVGLFPDTRTVEDCRSRCLAEKRCMFFSHDSEMRCFLCATCELRPPASQWSEERRFEWFAQAHNKLVRNKSARAVDPANALSCPPVVATSWAQSTLPFYSVGAVPEPVRRLRAWLPACREEEASETGRAAGGELARCARTEWETK